MTFQMLKLQIIGIMVLLKHQKKYNAIIGEQNKKMYKNLKPKINEKNKLATSKRK